jgi:hypothetical protein
MQEERRAKAEKVEKARLRKLQEASPETLRRLRELIRERYELDVQIWARRGARRPDLGIVLDKMDNADATMEEILGMLTLWGTTEMDPGDHLSGRGLRLSARDFSMVVIGIGRMVLPGKCESQRNLVRSNM